MEPAMTPTSRERQSRVYKIEREDGFRFVVYNAAEIGNPPDHAPDKWYFRPYPMPCWLDAGESFDTSEQAERAARAYPTQGNGDSLA
jgi:hypothetical protein